MPQPRFIRVKDTSTGHEYDAHEKAVLPKGVEPVKNYPPNDTGVARPMKPRRPKGGTKNSATTAATGDKNTTTEAVADGKKERDDERS